MPSETRYASVVDGVLQVRFPVRPHRRWVHELITVNSVKCTPRAYIGVVDDATLIAVGEDDALPGTERQTIRPIYPYDWPEKQPLIVTIEQNLSLWTTQIPSSPNLDDGASITVGTWIRASVPGQVIGIRWYWPATVPSSLPIPALYSNTGIELAKGGTWQSQIAGQWNSALFTAGPVSVPANTFFMPAVWTPNKYSATPQFFNGGSGFANGFLFSPPTGGGPAGATGNGRFVTPSGVDATYPTTDFLGGFYFTDALFIPDGIPVSVTARYDVERS